MTGVIERQVNVNGSSCRVLEKGAGKPLVVLSGYGGLPRWDEFHDRLSAARRVIAPSMPGQFGSERGHEVLHNSLDWLAMLQDLLLACKADASYDLVALSVAGMLACELACVGDPRLDKLVLVAPYGLYDEKRPSTNLYALAPGKRSGYLVSKPEKYAAVFAPPSDASPADQEEFSMLAYRSDEAVARLVWPFGDVGLSRRIHRIKTPTLLVWGEDDKLIPCEYAQTFARSVSGPSRVEIVPGAGHLATIDAPEEVASLVGAFVD